MSVMTSTHLFDVPIPSGRVSTRDGRCARADLACRQCSALVPALDEECISPAHRHMGRAGDLLHVVESLALCVDDFLRVFLGAVDPASVGLAYSLARRAFRESVRTCCACMLDYSFSLLLCRRLEAPGASVSPFFFLFPCAGTEPSVRSASHVCGVLATVWPLGVRVALFPLVVAPLGTTWDAWMLTLFVLRVHCPHLGERVAGSAWATWGHGHLGPLRSVLFRDP